LNTEPRACRAFNITTTKVEGTQKIYSNKPHAGPQYLTLGDVYKRLPQSGGVCPVRTFFGEGGRGDYSDADVRTFWRKKTPDFLKFIACPHGLVNGSRE